MAQLAGDLSLAEDCVQEACAAAVEQWPRDGLPANPGGWVVTVARRRALDHLRRESARPGKEREAMQEQAAAGLDDSAVAGDDQLALLFACCHPALDPASRVTLTLRVVCGLPTASIARLLLLPEPTVAQRIVRAKRKIRDAGIRLRVPDPGERPTRLASVLRAIYLTFTEGHSPYGTSAVVRDDLCEEALRLARGLHRLMPDEPEVTGLLALILLTSARSAARTDRDSAPVLLADQDRSRWDRGRLDEGRSLAETALAQRRPGPYQLQAAIAACHADAATAADTDWRQIAALYSELLRFDPSPVIEANRAVAVAYAEGPAAGLAILDTLAASSRLARWPQLQARALIVTGPEELRARFAQRSPAQLIEAIAALRPRPGDVPGYATRVALRELGRRAQFLDGQLDRLDELIGPLVTERAPGLLTLHGVGPDTAALLLVAAGDHPERLRSESSWAHLCGVAPIPASSGKTAGRYRLNRGGDRQANSALWRVVMVRLRSHEATRAYADRRGKEGLSKKEIIRCLKRYVAREVYRQLRAES